ncbi:MAG: ATP-binding protein [Clostridia bacterium]|nr:ATP-binding protein [Clostridia bacterium]
MKTLGFVVRNFRNIGLCEGKKSQEAFLRLAETGEKFGGLMILLGKSNSGKSNLLRALEKFGNSYLSLGGSKEFEQSKLLSQDDIPKSRSDLPSIILDSQEPAYYLHYSQDVAQKSGVARKKQEMGESFDFGEHIAELQDDFDNLDVYVEQNKHETISPIKLLLKDSSTGGGRFMRCTIEPLRNRDDRSSDELNVSYSEKLACPFVVGYKAFDVKQNFADYIDDPSQPIKSLAFKKHRLAICLDKNQNLQQKYFVGNAIMQDGTIVSLSNYQAQEIVDAKREQLRVPRIVFYEETHFCDDDLSTAPDKIQESKLFKGEITEELEQINKDFNALCNVQENEEKYKFKFNFEEFRLKIYKGKQLLSLEEQGRDFRKLFDFIFSLSQQINSLQRGDIVLIDDVEESLSIAAQKELRKFLKSRGQETGILFIVSTHSPFMLDMNYLDEIRILKEQDNGLGFEIVNDFTLNNSNEANILPATNDSFGIKYYHMLNPNSTIVIVESIEHYRYLATFASLYAKNRGDIQFIFLPFHAFGKESERKEALQSLIELGKKIVTPAVLLVENDCIGKETQKAADDFSGRIKVVALNEVLRLQTRFGEQEELKIEDLFAEEDQKNFGINKNNRGGTQSSFFKNATNHECLSQETRENFFALLAHLYCSDKRDILERPFLNALKFFYEQAVKNAERGTPKGKLETEKRLNESLEVLGLKCAVSFGSGKTAGQQGIAFVRKDTLGKEVVNGETPSPTRGIYLWFCYDKSAAPEERLYLEFGYSWDDDNVPCEAFRKLNDNEILKRDTRGGKYKAYPDFENHKDAILNDFLNFVSYYKSFDARDFRIQPTTGA